MSKKKLEELEKRIANLEKTPVRDMKAYCVGLSEYNSILDLKRIKKEYEAQMEELREIVCSDPIKVKGKSPDLGKSPVFCCSSNGEDVGENPFAWTERQMREYWIQVGENKSKEEIKKLREENDGFKQKIDELKAQNADLQVEVELKKACLKMQDFGYTCGLKIAKEEMEIAYNQAIDDAANAVMRTTLMSVDLDKKLKKLKKK